MVFPAFQEETYSSEDIAQLCDIAAIPEDRASDLKAVLEDAAANFRYYRAGLANAVSNRKAKQELRTLAKQAERLAAHLLGMSDEARNAFARKPRLDEMRLIKGDDLGPSLVIPLKQLGINAEGISLDIFALTELMRAAEIAAKYGVEQFPARTSGRPFDMAMHMWMVNIAEIWSVFSAFPFSCQVTDSNEPVSPAARFCTLALRSVAPEVPPSRAISAQKKYIKDKREKTGEK